MRSLLFSLLVAAGGSPGRSDPSPFLAAARSAAPDEPTRLACLNAWASVAEADARSGLAERPVGLGRRGARLLGRIEAGRVRVKVIDPLGVLGPVEAWWLRVDGAPRRLPAIEPGIYALPERRAGDRVELRASAPGCLPDRPLVVARLVVDDPLLPARAPAAPEVREPEPPAEGDSGFDGWWFVALGLAAISAGAAVVGELD